MPPEGRQAPQLQQNTGEKTEAVALQVEGFQLLAEGERGGQSCQFIGGETQCPQISQTADGAWEGG